MFRFSNKIEHGCKRHPSNGFKKNKDRSNEIARHDKIKINFIRAFKRNSKRSLFRPL
jgi:hypothetical protein